MKPKAPKKKDPKPSAKSGEAIESWETDYFKNWVDSFTSNCIKRIKDTYGEDVVNNYLNKFKK